MPSTYMFMPSTYMYSTYACVRAQVLEAMLMGGGELLLVARTSTHQEGQDVRLRERGARRYEKAALGDPCTAHLDQRHGKLGEDVQALEARAVPNESDKKLRQGEGVLVWRGWRCAWLCGAGAKRSSRCVASSALCVTSTSLTMCDELPLGTPAARGLSWPARGRAANEERARASPNPYAIVGKSAAPPLCHIWQARTSTHAPY